jgi:hypothetical protein
VCLESERNDAGLVDLVDPGELFGHVGSGDRGSRRVKHINDKLLAGKEAVCSEFPGTDCNRGRVILSRDRVSEHHRRTDSQHPDSEGSIQRIRHGFHPQSDTQPCFYTLYELYGTTLTAMVSSGDVICMGCRPRRILLVGATNVEIGFENQSPFGDSRLEDPERPPQLRSMYKPAIANSARLLPSKPPCTIVYYEPKCDLICTICKLLFLVRGWITLTVSVALN